MIDELHEIMMISKHDRCFSQSLFVSAYTEGCTCKSDTVETRIVGTEDRRNWFFPKGRCPFQIGEQIPASILKQTQMTGVMMEAEKENEVKDERS
jgi:hypothetical protein